MTLSAGQRRAVLFATLIPIGYKVFSLTVLKAILPLEVWLRYPVSFGADFTFLVIGFAFLISEWRRHAIRIAVVYFPAMLLLFTIIQVILFGYVYHIT